jgi:hypothetical protein
MSSYERYFINRVQIKPLTKIILVMEQYERKRNEIISIEDLQDETFILIMYYDYLPPLWSSGQSSWLQIQRPGFDSRHYQIFWGGGEGRKE